MGREEVFLFTTDAANDSKKQFEDFVRMYYRDIFKYCRFHLNSDRYAAEECTQETFLTFYSNINKLKNFENIRAYLFRIADNQINVYIRKSKKDYNAISYYLDDDSKTDKISLGYEEKFYFIEDNVNILELMNIVLGQLTGKERRLYSAAFQQNKNISQIAEQEKISVSAMKMRIQRLKAKIRKFAHEAIDGNEHVNLLR